MRRIGIRVSILCLIAVFGQAALCQEQAHKVSLCQIEGDPSSFNHKLLEITAVVSHDFEDFTLSDPKCPSHQGASVWLEYGGKTKAGTVYCCGVSPDQHRSKQLLVENIAIPLMEDDQFRAFDGLIQRKGATIALATLVGRFFAGQQSHSLEGNFWGGYGHLGCSSLFVIQRIESFTREGSK
jgi:hypothetical protein